MPTTKDQMELAAEEETALTPQTNGAVTAFADYDADEMEGLTVTFDRIRVPAGGGLSFEVPNQDDPDNPISMSKIEGVILDQYPVKAYYLSKFSGDNNPPDCVARDGKHGTPNEVAAAQGAGGECRQCPMNAWGSDPDGGRGKACKDMRRIYFLIPGAVWPNLIVLPPTSIQEFGNYMGKSILGRGLKSFQVVTEFSLRRAKNATGIDYSQLQFRRKEILPDEEAEKYALIGLQLRDQTRRFQEYTAEEIGKDLAED